MAGHSKYSNIKHRKGAQDAKRSKMFTKIQREIFSAVKYGGGEANEDFNPRLRLAILKAKACNMPKEKIDTAIKKATGAGADENFEYIRYDCHAKGGFGLIVETLTDSKNRTAGEVRATATKHGATMGETGSLDFSFQKIGVIVYCKEVNFNKLFESAVELCAQNVEELDEVHEVTTSFEDFHKVQAELAQTFGEPLEAQVQFRPIVAPEITQEQTESLAKLIDALEELDDVQNVWSVI